MKNPLPKAPPLKTRFPHIRSPRTRFLMTRAVRLPLVAACVAVLVAGGTALTIGSAQAATVDTSASYVLVNRNSGKALEVLNRSTAAGAAIVQWARNDGAWQQWQFVDSGGGYYRLRSRHSGLALTIDSASTADGANVAQRADTNAASQQFQLLDSDGGHVRLIGRNSGKALEVWSWSTADGGRISQFTDLNGANQQWQLVRLGSGGGQTPPPGQGPTTPPAPTTPAPGQTPPSSYPQPIALSGDTGTHDPEVTRTPNGTYLLAHTGNNISLKTSTDRVTWRNAGSAFPGGV